jgi:hypothetical protein
MSNCDFAVHADLLSDERKRACPKAAKPAMALLPAFKDKRFPFEESERIFRIARLYDKAVVYTSRSISLASMEIMVNLPSAALLEQYVRIQVQIQGYLVEQLTDLPKDWNSRPASPSTKAIGDRWALEKRSAVLKVPSVVVPAEHTTY